MKTIICIWGPENCGKTSVIWTIFGKLNLLGCEPQILSGQDFCTIVDYSECKVGFASMGDPGSSQRESMEELIRCGCEVIICASRTKGNTVTDIERLSEKHQYRLIWTSNFSCLNLSANGLNDLFGDAVVRLIDLCLRANDTCNTDLKII